MYAVDQPLSSPNQRKLEEWKNAPSPVMIDFAAPQDEQKERTLRVRLTIEELHQADCSETSSYCKEDTHTLSWQAVKIEERSIRHSVALALDQASCEQEQLKIL
jgi:hypothetical protein